MIDKINLNHILFLDIETVPQHPLFENLDEAGQKLYEQKTKFLQKDGQDASELYERAGIYAEFGKIICISVGYVHYGKDGSQLRLKSFYSDDEKELLTEFCITAVMNANGIAKKL